MSSNGFLFTHVFHLLCAVILMNILFITFGTNNKYGRDEITSRRIIIRRREAEEKKKKKKIKKKKEEEEE